MIMMYGWMNILFFCILLKCIVIDVCTILAGTHGNDGNNLIGIELKLNLIEKVDWYE